MNDNKYLLQTFKDLATLHLSTAANEFHRFNFMNFKLLQSSPEQIHSNRTKQQCQWVFEYTKEQIVKMMKSEFLST
jgi:plasmid maintenance system killer protein